MSISVSSTANGTIDVNSLVSQLMAVESQPVNALNTQVTNDQTLLSTFGNLKSLVSSFQTSLQTMSSASSFSAYKVLSSDLSVTGTATGSAVPGSYSVNVTSIANAQQLVTAGQASSTTAIGSGSSTTLTFNFGTINGTLNASTGAYNAGATFTNNGGGAKTVTIDSTNNTLSGIRDAINNANIGVTASIINDGSGTPYRLALSSSSGVSNSMTVAVSGDSAISSLLSNDPTGTQNLSETVSASNANLTVNGVAITSTSNAVTNAIQGVTLNLQAKTSAPVTVVVSQDATTMESTVNSFITAYNSLYGFLKTQTAYSSTNTSQASLMGDNDLLSMMDQMRQIVDTTVGTGTYNSLAMVGISTNPSDGTLSLNTTQFEAALSSNASDVTNLFSSSWGIGNQMSNWTMNAQNFTVMQRMSDLNSNISSLNTQISDWQNRLSLIQSGYMTQFTALNTLLSSFNTTQTYLTQQIATFSSNSKA